MNAKDWRLYGARDVVFALGMALFVSCASAETDHYAADGVHPEGGAQRVIAEVVAQAIISR